MRSFNERTNDYTSGGDRLLKTGGVSGLAASKICSVSSAVRLLLQHYPSTVVSFLQKG